MTIIVAATIAALFGLAYWALSRKTPSAAPVFERLECGGWRAETADGHEYRTSDIGIIWYHFPSGYRAHLELEMWLDKEWKAHKNRLRWTQ